MRKSTPESTSPAASKQFASSLLIISSYLLIISEASINDAQHWQISTTNSSYQTTPASNNRTSSQPIITSKSVNTNRAIKLNHSRGSLPADSFIELSRIVSNSINNRPISGREPKSSVNQQQVPTKSPLVISVNASLSSSTTSRARAGRFVKVVSDAGDQDEGAEIGNSEESGEIGAGDEERPATRQVGQVPKEGVAEVRRAARNVKRKMDLLDSRVDQIQSLIAEDHQPSSSANDSLSAFSSGDDSTDQGGSAATYLGNNDSANEAPVSSAPSGLVVNNIEAPQNTATDNSWSQALTEDATELADENRLMSGNQSRSLIESVIPGNKQRPGVQQPDESGTNQRVEPVSDQPESSFNTLAGPELELRSSANEARYLVNEQPPANSDQIASNGEQNGGNQTSLMRSEWSPNLNYQYFNELNAKNHGHSKAATVRANESPAAARPIIGTKFQNMTIVNSDTDLVNSFSSQQQQTLNPPSASASGSTKSRASNLDSDTRRAQESAASARGRKSPSVYTYSAGNYGKSSRELWAQQAAAQTRSPESSDTNSAGYEYLASRNDTLDSLSAPIQWPTFATASVNHNQQQQQQQQARQRQESGLVGLPASTVYNNGRYSSLMQPAQPDQDSGEDQQSALDRQQQMRKYSNLAADSEESSRPTVGSQSGDTYSVPRRLPISEQGVGSSSQQLLNDLKHRSSSQPDELSTFANNLDSSSSGNNLQADAHSIAAKQSVDSADYGDLNLRARQPSEDMNRQYESSGVARQASSGTMMQPSDGSQLQQSISNGYQNTNRASEMNNQRQFGPDSNQNPNPNARSSLAISETGNNEPSTSEASMLFEQQQQQNRQLNGANFNNQLNQYINQQQQQQQQVDSMQPAATSTYNNLLRQQQLSQIAANLVAQNPNVDMSGLVQRYHNQQQRLYAAAQQQQLQQQRLQQQQQQQLQMLQLPANEDGSAAFGNSIARAYYLPSVSANEQQQQQQAEARNSFVKSAFRRYSSPDRDSINYASSRSAQSHPQQVGDHSPPTIDLINPYTGSSSANFQPVYATNSQLDGRALRAANLAYYRAALAASAAAPTYLAADNQQLMSGGYSSQPSASNFQQQQQMFAPSMTASSGSAGQALYESPSQIKSAIAELSSSGSLSSDQSASSGQMPNPPSSGNQLSGIVAQQSSSPTSYSLKRGYLNSLFKPSASSRYYYTPTILSPINLAAPATLHSIYAPASQQTVSAASAAESLHTLPQMYTAHPYLQTASQQSVYDQQAAVAQQYQAAFAAASAAANGLLPQQMEPDMSESSLVASDSNGSPVGYSSAGDSSSSASEDSQTSQTATNSKSGAGGKGMTPWTNIAGLLLGILPFGILMASLLPAVTVSGRKKRELELSGRNFTDLLGWRPPSQVLNALLGIEQQPSGNLSMGSRGTVRSEPQLSSRLLSRLAGGRMSPGEPTEPSQQPSVFSTTLSSPTQITTPMPASNLNGSALQSASSIGVKSKVKKAFNALNSFITAAQNMKRKHRSSPMDAGAESTAMSSRSWNLPALVKSSLKLENLFNINELRRQLASVAQTRALVAHNYQILQNQHLQRSAGNSSASPTPSSAGDALLKTISLDEKNEPNRLAANKISESRSSSEAQFSGQQRIEPVATQPLFKEFKLTNLTSFIGAKSSIESASLKSSPTTTTSTTTEIPQTIDEEHHHHHHPHLNQRTETNIADKINVSGLNNKTRNHLEICLNQFLCRLTLKLNQSLKGAMKPKDENRRTKSNSTLAPEQLEKITKRYINQLVEQIEAEHPTVMLSANTQQQQQQQSLKRRRPIINATDWLAQPQQEESEDTSLSPLDVLYRNAMSNDCSTVYNCVELLQLERTLAKMKLKFS